MRRTVRAGVRVKVWHLGGKRVGVTGGRREFRIAFESKD